MWRQEMAATGIISVEGGERPLERAADRSGTDAFMVRHRTGVLVPLASRVEYYDRVTNNPNNPLYAEHYPRFTIRLGKRQFDGTLSRDVECQKRLLALDDPISRRFLPLYTFQSLVEPTDDGWRVIQSVRVGTEALFEYVRDRQLNDPTVGSVSRTRREADEYRIITVEKLRRAKVHVDAAECGERS